MVEIDGQVIELGASIAYAENLYVAEMAEAAGLPVGPPSKASPDGLTALFDGERFVFKESRWKLLTLIRMLWHYAFAPWRYRSFATTAAHRFARVYELQGNGTAFTRPHDLLRALDLFNLTQITMKQYIVDEIGVYGRFASEYVAAAGKVNYNQGNLDLNGMAGMISLIPATDPRLFRVQQGNQNLATGVMRLVNASVFLNTIVTGIAKKEDGMYTLELECSSSGGGGVSVSATGPVCDRTCCPSTPEAYDAVIIAAPLHSSGIEFSGIDLPVIPARKYQPTVVTIVKGTVRPTFFGLDPGVMPYDSVLLTERGAAAVPFSSLSKVGRGKGTGAIYKLFSTAPMPHAWLSILFNADYEVLVNKTWAAYPAYDAPENFPPFQLDQGLCYSNAWENAASAMETAAVGGRNCALLAAQYLGRGKQTVGEALQPRQLDVHNASLIEVKTHDVAAAAA